MKPLSINSILFQQSTIIVFMFVFKTINLQWMYAPKGKDCSILARMYTIKNHKILYVKEIAAKNVHVNYFAVYILWTNFVKKTYSRVAM